MEGKTLMRMVKINNFILTFFLLFSVGAFGSEGEASSAPSLNSEVLSEENLPAANENPKTDAEMAPEAETKVETETESVSDSDSVPSRPQKPRKRAKVKNSNKELKLFPMIEVSPIAEFVRIDFADSSTTLNQLRILSKPSFGAGVTLSRYRNENAVYSFSVRSMYYRFDEQLGQTLDTVQAATKWTFDFRFGETLSFLKRRVFLTYDAGAFQGYYLKRTDNQNFSLGHAWTPTVRIKGQYAFGSWESTKLFVALGVPLFFPTSSYGDAVHFGYGQFASLSSEHLVFSDYRFATGVSFERRLQSTDAIKQMQYNLSVELNVTKVF